MNDLRTLLHDSTAPSAAAPSPSLVQADLARGRTALRRRRTRRGARGSLVALAAAGAVALATQGVLGGGASTTATRPAPPVASSTLAATSLVAYTGQQPAGFTIDKVPAGWGVQLSDTSTLLLAPADQADQPAYQAGQAGTDEGEAVSFVDKIGVSMTTAATGAPGTDVGVDVGGRPGMLFAMEEEDADGNPVPSTTRTLYVEQPSGRYLAIQVWDASTWTDEQIVELGAGIHPTDATLTTGG